MGALMRATVMDIEELVRGDPHWWPGLLAGIAENGGAAMKDERNNRGWSWGALWRWIVEDDERYRDYTRALEAYVQDKALETVGIADDADPDGVAKAKLQVDTRFRLAGKVDRDRWGEKSELRLERVIEDETVLLERIRSLVSGNPQLREIVIGSGVIEEAELVPVALPKPEQDYEI